MKQLVIISILAALLGACKKNELGGKAEISGVVSHHGRPIPGAVVYIKLGATEFPGADSSRYDSHVAADSKGAYLIKCYKGSYYLYARGIDYLPNAEIVDGGVPVKVRSKEKVKADVPVSEVH